MSRFFSAQCSDPIKGEWASQVKKDLHFLNMTMFFEEIASYSKKSFKSCPSAGTQRECRLSLALSESVRHIAHWIRLRDCTSQWTKCSLIWDQRRIWAPHPLLDCECSGSVMTMRTCVTTAEMAAWNIPSLHENMAARNIPSSLWCGVPNVSRANREGISQQIRSAWISAPTWDLDLSLTKTWKWKTGREYEILFKKREYDV